MGFFQGFGSNVAALGQKLGGALGQIGSFAQNVASPILNAVQQAQAIQGQLEGLGRPPIAGTGSQPVAGEHPIAPLASVAPTAAQPPAIPTWLLVAGIGAVVLVLAKGASR